MNYRMIINMLGYVGYFEAGFLIMPLLCCLAYREFGVGVWYLAVAFLCLALGFALTRKKPKHRKLSPKEGMVTTALAWIMLSLLGALPFTLSGEIPSYIDAFFETVSGFTTTGSTILTDVEAMSYTGRFWRSFTHWVGGMGVLVFILAVLPAKGGVFMNLMKAESPGPSVGKLVPRLRDTAMYLYKIYLAMTVLQIVLLLLGGMPMFDALTMTFGSAGTGGFSVRNDGCASYTIYQQAVITVSMILFGVNFNSYFFLVKGRIKQAIRSEEVLTYFGIIAVATLLVTINILPMFQNLFLAFHHAFFQVGTIITTTGYSTTDFNLWPPLAKTVLVILMFSGACAGSTAGGIKVSRLVLMAKSIKKEIQLMLHPRSVHKVRMDGQLVEHDTIRGVNVYIAVYFLLFVGSILVVSADGKDLVSNFTAVATTINNVGPGLEIVGPLGSFASYSNLSKLIFSLDMLAGRLELFPILMLFVPATWKRKA